MYVKTTWTDGVTAANATRLNNLENGVDGGHRGFGSRFIRVAAADETQAVKDSCHYVCDGTADEVEINSALADCAVETLNLGGNGGTVLLVGRKFTCAAAVEIRSQTNLVGAYGPMATFIQNAVGFDPGATGGLIQLDTTSTQYATVRNLGVRRQSGQSYNGCGIYINEGTGQEYDAAIKLIDLYVYGVGSHGIRLENNSGGRLRSCVLQNVRVIAASGNGIYLNCPDTFLNHVDVGDCTGDGFYIEGANNQFTNCKAWYSDGNGFNIISGARDNQFTSCVAQDNNLHGFKISGQRATLSACCADSNGYPSDTGSGFFIESSGFNVHGTSSDKNEGARGISQQYGVQFSGTPKGMCNVMTWQNAVAASTGATASGSVINVVEQ